MIRDEAEQFQADRGAAFDFAGLAPLARIDVLVIDDCAMAPLSEPERRDGDVRIFVGGDGSRGLI